MERTYTIITNNDYLYQGEQTRTAKFDYRLVLVDGITAAADIHTKWYKWNTLTASSSSNTLSASIDQRGMDWSRYCKRPIPKNSSIFY